MANPFMIGNTVNTEQYNTQKEFKEYAWDFNRNSFIYNDDGSMKIVTKCAVKPRALALGI